MQSGSLFCVEAVATVREDIIDEHQLDDVAFGQISRLIEDEAAVLNCRLDGLHQRKAYATRTLHDSETGPTSRHRERLPDTR